MGILSWLVCGLIAGWLTGKIMGGPGKGFVADIVVGLIGAVAGGFLFGLLGLRTQGGFVYTLVVATIGAVALTWIFRKITAK